MGAPRTVLILGAVFGCAMFGAADMDLTIHPNVKGDFVVETALDLIKESCIFPNDKFFLRRIAFVESKDGLAPKTYRPGYDGGIWQIDKDQFNVTKNSPRSQKFFGPILQRFHIYWPDVTWSDLRKPLYSALAQELFIQQVGAPVPRGIEAQSVYWTNHIAGVSNTVSYNFTAIANSLQTRCHGTEMIDLLFIMDGSSSINPEDFEKAKMFVQDVISVFNIGPLGARISVMTYSSDADVEFYLDDHDTKLDVISHVANITWRSGASATDKALDLAIDSVFTSAHGSRSHVPKAAILFSDGQSNDFYKTKTAAERVRRQGVTIFAVGVGKDLDLFELKSVASDPDCTHLFLVQSYDEIETVKQELQHASCRTQYILGSQQEFKCGLNGGTCYVQTKNVSNVQVSVNCSTAVVYTSHVNPYPGVASYQFTSTATVENPLTIAVDLLNETYYMAVQTTLDTSLRAKRDVCFATVATNHPTTSVQLVCRQDGVDRECGIPDLLKYKPQLCKDNWYEIPNPCTREAVTAGRVTFPHPYNANMYLTCDLTGRVYVVVCPKGTTFDKTTSQCGVVDTGHRVDNHTVAEINPCTADKLFDGHFFFPFVGDAHKFVHCDVWGHPWVQQCQDKFIWDHKEMTCVEEFLIGPTVHPEHYNPCTRESIAAGKLFFPYPSDVRRYIRCDAFGRAFVMPCDPGTSWDQEVSVCV